MSSKTFFLLQDLLDKSSSAWFYKNWELFKNPIIDKLDTKSGRDRIVNRQ